MRWTPGGNSDDVEDRRDESGGGGFRPGGIHIGLGGIVILFVLSLIFKRDFLSLVSTGSMGTSTTVSQPDPARDQHEEPLVQFVSFVLDDAQSTWSRMHLRHAKLGTSIALPQRRSQRLLPINTALCQSLRLWAGTGAVARANWPETLPLELSY